MAAHPVNRRGLKVAPTREDVGRPLPRRPLNDGRFWPDSAESLVVDQGTSDGRFRTFPVAGFKNSRGRASGAERT